MRVKVLKIFGVLGIAVLVVAGCSSSTPTAEDETDNVLANTKVSATEDPVDGIDSTDSSTEDDLGKPDESGPERRDPAEPFAVGVVHKPDAEVIVASFDPLEPGTYRTGALGTVMSFTTSEGLHIQPNSGGWFVLSDLSSQQPDDRDIVFMRVGDFFDPTAPNAPFEEQTLWPKDDFLGWLENLDDGIDATDPIETTVSGLPAITVDLKLTEDMKCGFAAGICAGFFTTHAEVKALNRGAEYRVWIVEQADEDPLAVIAGIPRTEDASWFARADAVLDTVAFGDVAPNPAQSLEPGPIEMRMLGGVEVTLPENFAELTKGGSHLYKTSTDRSLTIFPIGNEPGVLLPGSEPGVIFISERLYDNGGDPITSVDDLIDILTAANNDLTELDPMTVDGVNVRVFDQTSEDVWSLPFGFSPLDGDSGFLGWDTPAAGRIWLIEHPDRGLMMMSTHSFDDAGELLPAMNELGTAMMESMTFSE